MSYQLFNTIAESLYAVVGGNIILPMLVVGFLLILLLVAKAGKTAIVIIIVPIISVLFTVGTSKFFEGVGLSTQWVPVTGWILAGFIVAGLFWKIMQ